MRNRLIAATAAILVVAGVAIAGAQTTTAPPTVAASLAKGKAPALQGADALGTGAVTFSVSAASGRRDFTLVKVPNGTDPVAYQEEVRKLDGNSTDAIDKLDLVSDVTARKGAPETVTVKLEPGSYLAVDTSDDHHTDFPSSVVNVGSSPSGAVAPKPRATVSLQSYKFTLTRSLPRSGVVRFVNPSHTTHMAVSFKVSSAAKASALVSALKRGANPEKTIPRYARGEGTGSNPIGPGRAQDVHVSQRAGNYVFVCFWASKASKGRPHFALGMAKSYRVR